MTRLASSILLLSSFAFAQRGGGDWMTSGFDAQRSFWVRTDGKISVATLSKPGFEAVWKHKPTNAARQLNTLTPPSLLDFYIGYKGFRALGFVGASNDRVVAYDIDLGRVEWEKTLGSSPTSNAAGCPSGLTAAVTRPTVLAYPPVPSGAGPGRGTPAKGGVGEPMEGALTLKRLPPPAPPKPVAPKPVPAAKVDPNAANPFSPRVQWAVAVTGDGKLHQLYVSNGEEPVPAMPFLPAGANANGLIVIDGVAYAATANGCGNSADGVYALDLKSKAVSSWKAPGAVAGFAMDPSGNVYAAAGSTLAALAPKTLAERDSFKGSSPFTSSPVVFDFKGKNLAAATTADGRLHVLDTGALSAPVASTMFGTPGYPTGGVASWQDPAGNRWILAPSGNDVTAFKLVQSGTDHSLQVAWKSPALVSPAPPVVINGVVFVLSTGKFLAPDVKTTIAKSVPAVLYALDAQTGKELWNSGKAITSFVHSGGLSAGGGRVYVAAYDGTQYAFSFPMEH